jgi:hypothetical protein
MSIILATWEAEIGKTAVQGQPRQKVQETPSQQKKLGAMVHAWHPKDKGSIDRRRDLISKGWSVAQTVEHLLASSRP